jgi:hypothetical protein
VSETPNYPRPWGTVTGPRTTQQNPTVVVSAREDRVLYGPRGEVIYRIEDRPIGFRRPS